MIHCRLCRSQHTRLSFTAPNNHGRIRIDNTRYNLYYCQDCTSYFLDLKTSSQYYQQAYQGSYYPSPSKFINFLNNVSFILKRIRIETLLGFPNHIKILDIGCGPGEFLSHLPSQYRKHGLEINKKAARAASQKGIKMSTSDIQKSSLPANYYDCITLWHSLEHFDSPQTVIDKIYHSLRPGGLIIMNTPNSNSLGFRLGKQDYFHLDAPRHLYLPNPTSLKLALTGSGFHTIKSTPQIFEYPLDLFWSVRQHPWRAIIYVFYPFLKLFSSETITTTAFK